MTRKFLKCSILKKNSSELLLNEYRYYKRPVCANDRFSAGGQACIINGPGLRCGGESAGGAICHQVALLLPDSVSLISSFSPFCSCLFLLSLPVCTLSSLDLVTWGWNPAPPFPRGQPPPWRGARGAPVPRAARRSLWVPARVESDGDRPGPWVSARACSTCISPGPGSLSLLPPRRLCLCDESPDPAAHPLRLGLAPGSPARGGAFTPGPPRAGPQPHAPCLPSDLSAWGSGFDNPKPSGGDPPCAKRPGSIKVIV